jgi:hypothetical protein
MQIQIHHSLDRRLKDAAHAAGLRPGVFVGQIVEAELALREKAAARLEARSAVRSGDVSSADQVRP